MKKATEDIYTNEIMFTRDVIEKFAREYTICPFEFSLYLSYFSEVIICDYNYAFCPKSHLKRYFEEKNYEPILLVDESHNLVSRSKSMYSAELLKSSIIKLKKLLKNEKIRVNQEINSLVKNFDNLGDKKSLFINELTNEFIDSFDRLFYKLNKYLAENADFSERDEVITIYFEMNDFSRILEYFNDAYKVRIETKGDVKVSLICLDASEFLFNTVSNFCYGTVFFSATLSPLEYYKQLITQGEGEHIVLKSPFPKENLNIIVQDSISTKYRNRDDSVSEIVKTIKTMIDNKKGKFIVFFPSYTYLEKVNNSLDVNINKVTQRRDMTYKERSVFLDKFKEEESIIGLFVMGGIFAEGIDYVGDMLDGVIIVGVGLPMYGDYNNMLKSYFDEKFGNGFDYAYTFPGINKVIQAVGRLIRTEIDTGVAILIDERFSNYKYRNLFPPEWSHYKVINDTNEIKKKIGLFWSDKFENR
ncbi:hypothetical protein KHQ82_06180 [Mycoplasmatota bacterium]|nr:hypothetical protein KHQ82_06180 [Mycoplasmatota bacterium]